MLCHAIPGALQFPACNSKHQASLSTTTSTPPSTLCNSTFDALQLHPRRSATPPSTLCNSTLDSLQLHLRCSATPPSMLCNPEGGPPLVFGMLHGHTSSSCILSTFALCCSCRVQMAEMAMVLINATVAMFWCQFVICCSWLGCYSS